MYKYSPGRFKRAQRRINFMIMLKAFSRDKMSLMVSERYQRRMRKGLNMIKQERALGLKKSAL
jgi:hypothetical protein